MSGASLQRIVNLCWFSEQFLRVLYHKMNLFQALARSKISQDPSAEIFNLRSTPSTPAGGGVMMFNVDVIYPNPTSSISKTVN